jgi:hypothetical protein
LPNGIHPCGFDRKGKKFIDILRHYKTCSHEWCQWRNAAAQDFGKRLVADMRRHHQAQN